MADVAGGGEEVVACAPVVVEGAEGTAAMQGPPVVALLVSVHGQTGEGGGGHNGCDEGGGGVVSGCNYVGVGARRGDSPRGDSVSGWVEVYDDCGESRDDNESKSA